MDIRFIFIAMFIYIVGIEAFDGCSFDGRNYNKDDIITIPHCLGEMTCLGNYNLSPIRPATHGDCRQTRSVDGQTGCWFDGRVYAKNDVIVFKKCLGEMTCLGHNNYSPIRPAPPTCAHGDTPF